MKKILTWIKPTGDWMHIWNYIWAFKPFMELAKWKKAYIFIADYHSLTSVCDKEIMQKNKNRFLKEYFSLLPKDTQIIVFEQSKIKNINNISWILSSITPYSMMLRAHTFKDSKNKNNEINMAVFNYPILMTADIISYDIDIVPVWKDQIQHLEFSRNIARNFNKIYNTKLFKIPECSIKEWCGIIKWTDGRKMSKSYKNNISIFDDEKILKKKIMSIKTWSETLAQKKDPEKCNIFSFIKLFATKSKQKEISDKYKAWNYWYGHAKLELLQIILDYFKDAREKYKSFDNNMNYIEKKLKQWNKQANEIVDKKFLEIKKIIWL